MHRDSNVGNHRTDAVGGTLLKREADTLLHQPAISTANVEGRHLAGYTGRSTDPSSSSGSTRTGLAILNQHGYGSMAVVLAGGIWLLVRMMAGWWLLAARKDDGVFCGGLLAARR